MQLTMAEIESPYCTPPGHCIHKDLSSHCRVCMIIGQRIEDAMSGEDTGEVGRNQIIMNSYFHDEEFGL